MLYLLYLKQTRTQTRGVVMHQLRTVAHAYPRAMIVPQPPLIHYYAHTSVCNEEFKVFEISERVVDTARKLSKFVGGLYLEKYSKL